MMQYTGKFTVRRIVQARLIRKYNPDSHYCNAIFNFIKSRAIKNRDTSAFFSVDAKCKVSVGEPDFPRAAVTRGKKVIVGVNQPFQVGDHDFNKISIISDAVFVQNIPENHEEQANVLSQEGITKSWFSGQVYYSFKNMVTQGSSTLRGVVEMAKIMSQNYAYISRFYAISDGGGDRRVDFL